MEITEDREQEGRDMINRVSTEEQAGVVILSDSKESNIKYHPEQRVESANSTGEETLHHSTPQNDTNTEESFVSSISQDDQAPLSETLKPSNLETSEPDSETESSEPSPQSSIVNSQLSISNPLSSIANALKSDLKAQVEAVLFVSDTPLKAGAIAKMLNASYDDVQSSLVQLIQEYEDRNGGLEIGTDDGYIIQVKIQYLNIVTDMMPLELNPGPMRTLSAIALKEPVLQSEVIDMRGSGAYEHINELVEMDLITKKPKGLSFALATTTKFQQYFRLTQDANKVRDKLQEEASRLAKEKVRRKQEEELAISQPVEQPVIS